MVRGFFIFVIENREVSLMKNQQNSFKKHLPSPESFLTDIFAIASFFLPAIKIPHYLFAIASAVVILYSLAVTEKPKNLILQGLYGFVLIGVIGSIAGVFYLVSDFNPLFAVLGVLLSMFLLLFHSSGNKSLQAVLGKIYAHRSRIVLLPLSFNVFLIGADYMFHYKFPLVYAAFAIILVYVPLRLFLSLKKPAKFSGVILAFITLFIYANGFVKDALKSPIYAVWDYVGEANFAPGDEILEVSEKNNHAKVKFYNAIAGKLFKKPNRGPLMFTNQSIEFRVEKVKNTWQITEAHLSNGLHYKITKEQNKYKTQQFWDEEDE